MENPDHVITEESNQTYEEEFLNEPVETYSKDSLLVRCKEVIEQLH